MTAPGLTQRQRRRIVWDGICLGKTPRQLARYLEVSETTIRRDMRAVGSPDPATAGMPDACRVRPGDRGVFL